MDPPAGQMSALTTKLTVHKTVKCWSCLTSALSPPSSPGISEAHVWQDGGFLIRRGESTRCEGRHQRAEVCRRSVVHPGPALQRTGKLMFQFQELLSP